jgi:hypothetical protein
MKSVTVYTQVLPWALVLQVEKSQAIKRLSIVVAST